MTRDEMNEAIDNWWLLQEDNVRTSFEEARDAGGARNIRDEYWFMKGWVARGA